MTTRPYSWLRRWLGGSCLLACMLGAPAVLAQASAPSATPPDDDVFTAAARPATTAPVLDGDVLGDAAWAAAVPITGFWQTTPDEGVPATERTEVRLLYDATTLYVSVVCYDREPQRIIVSDSRRDASLDETDSFRFILDTYQDGQNGFVFGTNPAGLEYDAQVTNQGQGGFGGGRQQAGSGGGFNINWDGSWTVQARVSDIGWSAEFAIPFRTLRYPSRTEQTWGINFQRNIRRRNEQAYWTKLPRQFNLNRVSMAGTLTDLRTPHVRNLKVMPYVLSQVRRDYDVADDRTDASGDFGVDLKYSLSPSLTIDATYNTDFAQVEVDEQQVNLDRFNLFFPEKRPFFLENAGLFSVGETAEVELFFSRRIGIGAGGTAVPILGGARLSGNVAEHTKVGLLEMQTASVRSDGVASSNFAVARVQQELPNRSAIGALFTNRVGSGSLAPPDDHNRLLALDGRLGVGQYGEVSGFVARSATPGTTENQHAFHLQGRYDAESWLLLAGYTEVASGFNPEVGFLQRQAYRKATGTIFRRIRPSDFLGLHEIRPHSTYRGYWSFNGFQQTGYWHIDSHWEWQNGYEIHTGFNFTREGVRNAFQIVEGVTVPVGTYDHREAQIVAFTNRGAWASAGLRSVIGGFFGGDRVANTFDVQMRLGEAFTTVFSLSRNDITLPDGSFTTNLFRARLSYAFTPRIYLQSLLQYNDQADLWSANLRFGWLREANTGLFVVYNQTNAIDGLTGGLQQQGLTLKYTHLFDVLR